MGIDYALHRGQESISKGHDHNLVFKPLYPSVILSLTAM